MIKMKILQLLKFWFFLFLQYDITQISLQRNENINKISNFAHFNLIIAVHVSINDFIYY